MFRDVPGCCGMFHVPGFIDTLSNDQLFQLWKKWKYIRDLTVKAGQAYPPSFY